METVSTHIRLAIEALLHAHAQANMFRSAKHPHYMEGVPDNLKRAESSLRAAMREAEEINSES